LRLVRNGEVVPYVFAQQLLTAFRYRDGVKPDSAFGQQDLAQPTSRPAAWRILRTAKLDGRTSPPNYAKPSKSRYSQVGVVSGAGGSAMTPDGFRGLLGTKNDAQLVGLCLRDDILPWAFQTAPERWTTFRNVLVAELGVQHSDITVVGSGRFGFSLKPRNNFKSFCDSSDIDVVVVNHDLFDRLWVALLKAACPRSPMTSYLGGWLRKRRNEVYTGWLTPLEIELDTRIYGARAKPVAEFNALWFNTFKKAARHPPRRHEDVAARLYRSWQHAELYHLNSLAELRMSLTT
jgi:hypothetical protein